MQSALDLRNNEPKRIIKTRSSLVEYITTSPLQRPRPALKLIWVTPPGWSHFLKTTFAATASTATSNASRTSAYRTMTLAGPSQCSHLLFTRQLMDSWR